ncbi:MAG: hypothetical protein LH614_01185 [Pyrinomonadaceae bacterium]|nr:hypothetical protein [Pyrinomonadaceae bacterium]
MDIEPKIIDRLSDLIQRGEEIAKSTKHYANGSFSYASEAAIQWKVSCLSFLEKIFEDKSIYYKQFENTFSQNMQRTHSAPFFGECVSVIRAAKGDYENGYLFDTRALIEAEVLDDFLEQSEHLLTQGYSTAAAVIAGSVLEDGLRKLCVKNGITLSAKPKLDTMNADLAKANVYNLLKQKQITALADLRNKAAHGQGGFTKEDVENMIRDVRRFTVDYFS